MLSGRDSPCKRKKSTPSRPGEVSPNTPPTTQKEDPPTIHFPLQTRLHLRSDRTSHYNSTQTQESAGGPEGPSQEKAIEVRKRCSCGRVLVYSSAATASAPSSSSLSISMPMSSVVLSPCISMSFTTVRPREIGRAVQHNG